VPAPNPYYLNAAVYEEDGKQANTILYYFDFHQPIWYEFPLPEGSFRAEWIDPLAMTVTPPSWTLLREGEDAELPGKPFQALRFRAVEAVSAESQVLWNVREEANRGTVLPILDQKADSRMGHRNPAGLKPIVCLTSPARLKSCPDHKAGF